jgi:hypothetical protein
MNLSIRGLSKLLSSSEDVEDIDIYRDEIVNLIPEIVKMVNFDQNNDAHQYDLWIHSLHTVVNLPRDINDNVIHIAALLHDIGKPDCIVVKPNDPDYHYYGHPAVSYDIIRNSNLINTMREEEYSDRDIAKMLYYIRYHDYRIQNNGKEFDTVYLRTHLRFLTVEEFKNLMKLEVADAKAHIIKPKIKERIEVCTRWTTEYADEVYKLILEEDDTNPDLRKETHKSSLISSDIFKGII